ncbi:hypothetical protein MPH_07156 [Macrophomina phaseolina MS6]|uniref:Uncharacterized protein n=1 Tax=Macrophomina phaseolina (strain MS6) TaxID=1126212 RepID=K2R0E7_MACPH|nr:hypothetical protein MPH_07156 [Macrophomina phaseolina MS6]
MADTAAHHSGLGARLKGVLRPKKSRARLSKKPPSESVSAEIVRRNNETISKSASQLLGQDVLKSQPHPQPQPSPVSHATTPDASLIDRHTGERRDITALIHGLQDSFEPGEDDIPEEFDENRPPGEPLIESLPPKLWHKIADEYLSPADAASLAFTNKALANILGPGPWETLRLPENRLYRIQFLAPMDRHLPNHLLCFPCGTYHLRTQPGKEELKPLHVLNPLFDCPNAQNPLSPPPRLRLTPNRNLPFTFVQLTTRAERYGPQYGIPVENLFRRWKDTASGWSHHTRYYVINGHFYLRVVSFAFAPAGLPPSGQRHLLYSREDYTPYFSVCAHWRDGELMNLCKCALNHIPKPRQGNGPEQQLARKIDQRRHAPTATQVVSQCTECKPIRRCTECPTEYLIELKLAEDKGDRYQKFKQSISVTRWSDLGDGTTPASPEWAAVNGEAEFDSFKAIGKRAVSGIFESQAGDFMPYQAVKSLNPKGIKKGEEGNSWY